MSGVAVREGQIAEQIGVCRIVFKDDVGVAHTGAHSVPAARDADVILNGLQIIGRTRTPEIALADVGQPELGKATFRIPGTSGRSGASPTSPSSVTNSGPLIGGKIGRLLVAIPQRNSLMMVGEKTWVYEIVAAWFFRVTWPCWIVGSVPRKSSMAKSCFVYRPMIESFAVNR